MATNMASAPRSASRPTSCTRADRWAWRASRRRSSSSWAMGKCAANPAALADRPRHILPIIVLSQFAGCSLWFAGNAVLGALQLPPEPLGYITSAVQIGFIAGTLAFAFFALSDLFSPRILFFVCALAGAAFNLASVAVGESMAAWLLLRFATGFFLAGVYPVGMKIAAGWHARDLGKALGFLVGALVLGTAFPHFLPGIGQSPPWQ